MEKSFHSRSKPRRRSWHALTNFDVQWHGICALRYLGGECLCCSGELNIPARTPKQIHPQLIREENIRQGRVLPMKPVERRKRQIKTRSQLFSIEEALGPPEVVGTSASGPSGFARETLIHKVDQRQVLPGKDSDGENECRISYLKADVSSSAVIEHHVTANEKQKFTRRADDAKNSVCEIHQGEVCLSENLAGSSAQKNRNNQSGIQEDLDQESKEVPGDLQGRLPHSVRMPGGQEKLPADDRSSVNYSLQPTTSSTEGCHGDTNPELGQLAETKSNLGVVEIASPPLCHQSETQNTALSLEGQQLQGQGRSRDQRVVNGSTWHADIPLQTEHVEEYLSKASVESITRKFESGKNWNKEPQAIGGMEEECAEISNMTCNPKNMNRNLCETGHVPSVVHQGVWEISQSRGVLQDVNMQEESGAMFTENSEQEESWSHSSSHTGSESGSEAQLTTSGVVQEWRRFPSPSEAELGGEKKAIPFVSELTMQEIRYNRGLKLQRDTLLVDVHKIRETASV